MPAKTHTAVNARVRIVGHHAKAGATGVIVAGDDPEAVGGCVFVRLDGEVDYRTVAQANVIRI